MCKKIGMKFKGKTKAQLKELLVTEVVTSEALKNKTASNLNVKQLREKCKSLCLSTYGSKVELIKRV